jgi:protein-tyrosine phosphatase
MTPEAASALRTLGVDPGRHVSRVLTLELLEAAEAVFVMTRSHKRSAAAIAPDQAHKIQLLDTEGGDITDPIGGEEDVYLATARRLHDLVRVRLQSVLVNAPAKT